MSYEIVPEGAQVAIANPVQEAIFEVLGGIVEAAKAMKLSRQSVYYIAGLWPIRDRNMALKIEQATAKAGRLVPAVELLDLSPWLGPDFHSPDPKIRKRAELARRLKSAPAQNRTGTLGRDAATEVARAA